MDLPSFHKAAVLKEWGKTPRFEVLELPLPEPGPTEVLVRLSVTGICGTDLALAAGELGATRKIVGHEGIGRVAKLGSSLDESKVNIGQRVGVSWVRGVCGNCSTCLHDGGEARCVEQIHSGRKVDGTFAQFTIVPYAYLIRLPEGPPDYMLAPIMCGGVTSYKALKSCGAIPGSWVVISGAGGGLGSLGIQYAREMGYRVIAIDAGNEKEDYCIRLGAEAYVDIFQEKDVAQVVKQLTGGLGASAAIVAAGSGHAYQDALHMLAPFGTLVCVGITPPSQNIQFHPLLLIDNGIKIIGSMVGTRGDIQEAVEYVKRGKVVPEVHLATLDQMPEIISLCATNKTTGKFVIDLSSDQKKGNLEASL